MEKHHRKSTFWEQASCWELSGKITNPPNLVILTWPCEVHQINPPQHCHWQATFSSAPKWAELPLDSCFLPLPFSSFNMRWYKSRHREERVCMLCLDSRGQCVSSLSAGVSRDRTVIEYRLCHKRKGAFYHTEGFQLQTLGSNKPKSAHITQTKHKPP